ncbi:hypothetical protein OROHE_000362 [Orobanche hederae]
MESEDQEEEQDGEAGSGLGYDGSLGNSNPTRVPTKMPSQVEAVHPLPLSRPRYKECLKNHAVVMGGHAVDGCGEFMPAGEEGTLGFLKCAACDCHRNFHRKEKEPGCVTSGTLPFNQYPPQPQLLLAAHHPHRPFGYRGGYVHVAPPRRAKEPLALPSTSVGGGGGRSGSRDEMEGYYSNSNPRGKNKRFRTKFTQEQKDKMLDLAYRLDWKIQKQDEEAVQQFCSEVGVKRHVLKVWMHNNKHTFGKKT